MDKALQAYFKQEKKEGATFLGLGIVALLLAMLCCLRWSDEFYLGLSVPLALVGLIELLVGAVAYARSDRQFDLLASIFREDPATYAQREYRRMMRVIRNFDLYRWTGLVLCLIGMLIILASWLAKDEPFWLGLGLGLFLQSAALLILDQISEKRASKYVAFIEDFRKKL